PKTVTAKRRDPSLATKLLGKTPVFLIWLVFVSPSLLGKDPCVDGRLAMEQERLRQLIVHRDPVGFQRAITALPGAQPDLLASKIHVHPLQPKNFGRVWLTNG